MDNIDLTTAADISQIPEKIGYLHEIGLTWGYGPTSMIEWTLEHIHIYSGMPWWGSIACTAVALRLLTFPFYLKASDVTARQSALVSVTNPITARIKEMQRQKNNDAVVQATRELMATRKAAGISFRGQFAPVVMQGILGFCGFKLLRALSTLPVPGFRDGGFLWLSDLTVSDPWGIMPILMGASVHLLIRLGGESGAQNLDAMTSNMRNMMLYAMPGVIILIMSWQPGALCVWFAASGALGMGQAIMLQRPAVRRFFNIAPLYKPTKQESAESNPLKALMDGLRPGGPPQRLRPSIDMGGRGRNGPYTQSQWQAPNLHTKASSSSGRVIDVQASPSRAATPSQSSGNDSDMVSPNRPQNSPTDGIGRWVEGVRGKFKDTMGTFSEQAKAKTEKNMLAAKRKAADDYERRAKQRGR